MQAKVKITQFQVLPGAGSVDHSAGVIRGVSVLSIGPALGHGISIDREGLQQCLEACQRRGSVKLITKHDGEFEDITGSIQNFRIEGDQVRGDVSLLENHPLRSRVLEIAEKIPTEFGLSIECDSRHVDSPDGNGKLFRCGDVDAIALVPRPAANPTGLFAAKPVDTHAKAKRIARKNLTPMTKLKSALQKFAQVAKLEEGDELDNVIDAIVEAVKEDSAPVASIEDRLKKLEDASAEPSDEEKEKMKKLAEEEEVKKGEELSKLARKIASEEVTKFTKEIGLVKSAKPGEGFIVPGDTKTKFETALGTIMAAGAPSRGVALARLAKDKPEIYNAAREANLL